MKTGAKIALGVFGIAAAGGIGYMIYRSIRVKNAKVQILIKNVSNDKKVEYVYTLDGKVEGGGIATWNANKVRVDYDSGKGSKRYDITETYLPNGLIISSVNLSGKRTGKIIDFRNKSVKDFSGNPQEALKAALKTLQNLNI